MVSSSSCTFARRVFEVAAGFVALVDTHDPGAGALEQPPIVVLDVGIDDGDEGQPEDAAEDGERRAGVARGRLDDRRGPADVAAPDGVAQHVVGGAILEAADDAVVLELGEEVQGAGAPGARPGSAASRRRAPRREPAAPDRLPHASRGAPSPRSAPSRGPIRCGSTPTTFACCPARRNSRRAPALPAETGAR